MDGALYKILQGGVVPIVKGVQRGTVAGNATVTISPVDPNKSIVLLNGAAVSVYGTVRDNTVSMGAGGSGYVSAFDGSSFTVGGAEFTAPYSYYNPDIKYTTPSIINSWQVVEFY